MWYFFFFLVIALSVHIRYTISDYVFGVSSLFIQCMLASFNSNVTGGTAYLGGASDSLLCFCWFGEGVEVKSLGFMCSVVQMIVCLFFLFLVAIVLSVLLFKLMIIPLVSSFFSSTSSSLQLYVIILVKGIHNGNPIAQRRKLDTLYDLLQHSGVNWIPCTTCYSIAA